MNYRATTKFSVSTSSTWDRFRLPLPNGNFSIVLASLQANYSFNRFLTLTSVIQLDTSNTQAVSANVRLRYNYRPDSDLYVIFNEGTQFTSIAPAKREAQTKVVRMILPERAQAAVAGGTK